MLRCPTCKRPVPDEPNLPLPFCNQRCKLADLANWLDGRYVVRAASVSEELPFDACEALLSADEE